MGALYSVASGVFEAGFRILGLDLRVEGLAHLPSEGPAILAANHVGYLDFAFVMLSPPRPRREVRYLARGDLFDGRLLGGALRSLGVVPVEEHRDPAGTVATAQRLLEAGELVGLHPEGTVNPTFWPLRGRSGAVRLARATGAPIVPVGVWGSQRLLTKWRPREWPGRGVRIDVRYGAPWTPGDGSTRAETGELMTRITDLVDRAIADQAAEPGAWWVPAVRGGGAPDAEETARRLEAQRASRRAQRRGEG